MYINSNDKFFIEGLTYIPNFISPKEHNPLIHEIDKEIWSSELKRRVQHYGYKYDYKLRKIDKSMKIGELPIFTNEILSKLENFFLEKPDQLIVNEYIPGQGISNHIDCQPCFTDTITSLSLGSYCVMNFTRGNKIINYLLEPCSLVILKDEARYEWMHGIKAIKTDNYFEQKIERKRRISLTFRKTILNL